MSKEKILIKKEVSNYKKIKCNNNDMLIFSIIGCLTIFVNHYNRIITTEMAFLAYMLLIFFHVILSDKDCKKEKEE
jgi:hypothetical protein